jgi:hypothetical protein
MFEEYIPGFGYRDAATSSAAFPFINKDLLINKITEGANKGKILFKFWNEENRTFGDKYSMMAGCAKILDTEYGKNEQLRNIKLEGMKIRKVQTNTVERVVYNFLLDLGYVNEFPDKYLTHGGELILRLRNKFSEKIKAIPTTSNDLGDIIDELKKVRQELFDFQREDYEKWVFDTDTKKYNL